MNKEDNFKAVYDRYGAQLDKEDGLVNSRVNWLLATQTILFAAIKIGKENASPEILKAIRVVGFCSSIALLCAIFAACASFKRYRSQLLEKYEEVKDIIPRIDYPQLGRRMCILYAGDFGCLALPIIFAIGWLII
jgi:hypothetical protein